jgi:ketosteroid isomerase-like protein
MSERNIQVLRETLAAFNSGDLERILDFVHPQFEGVVPPEFSAEPDTYRGHEGIRRYFRTFEEVMEEVRFEPERFWQAGDAVAVTMRLTAKGRQTSIPVEQRLAQVWRLRDGRVVGVQSYVSVSEAVEIAGASGAGEQW